MPNKFVAKEAEPPSTPDDEPDDDEGGDDDEEPALKTVTSNDVGKQTKTKADK